ncbi:glycosyl hydrolase [Streptomyces davaonensis JCM 4913]|uniref:Glycosyl hydrolase n=2 Tax=Streptomyces davaonensis TaxID=348043 RepID=K4R8X1_STRDJ|nr:glycosyl hydrolase [Streptomyces davaonensis JCM 4913]
MRRYPPVADHGMVGDLQTVALVSSDGVINWFCAPRFDSPSFFASLLDHDRGGHFAITVDGADVSTRQLYLADTAVLITRFLTPEGVGEVVDFMPVDRSETATDRHRLIRVIRVTRGRIRFSVACRPRFDYARAGHRLTLHEGVAHFSGPGIDVHVQPAGPLTLQRDGVDVVADVELAQGQVAATVLTVCAAGGQQPPPPTRDSIRADFEATCHFWYRWIHRSTYQGRWTESVNRSAITLKLLTYAPSGAPVAAATAGLPEQIGGERNWDYRYTWVRDASLSLNALFGLGFDEEAHAFRHWIGERLREGRTVTGEPLQIMYRIDGDPHLAEETLDHLEGYRSSAPVRIGNGAADQLQLDIYGEATYAFTRTEDLAHHMHYDGWLALRDMLDWLVDNWDRADEGIWETRGGRKDFTYSRLMCWTAFDRGIHVARDLARPADLTAWTTARDAILAQIMDRGWSTTRRAFVQHYGSEVLDASLLLMPTVGFITPRDPRWLSTLDAMDTELVSDSLVYRYDPAASPDGLRGSEGTFSLCSFLYVDALAHSDRLDQARYAFDKMLTYANHVGLFGEEIGPTGEQLGNFPQAFTHLALITAALTLDEELNRPVHPRWKN